MLKERRKNSPSISSCTFFSNIIILYKTSAHSYKIISADPALEISIEISYWRSNISQPLLLISITSKNSSNSKSMKSKMILCATHKLNHSLQAPIRTQKCRPSWILATLKQPLWLIIIADLTSLTFSDFAAGKPHRLWPFFFLSHTFFNGTGRNKNSLLYSIVLHLALFESKNVNTPKKHVQSGAESTDVRIVPHFHQKNTKKI